MVISVNFLPGARGGVAWDEAIATAETIELPHWIMKGLAVKLKKLPVIEHHTGVTRQH